jgi:hypothetical protein
LTVAGVSFQDAMLVPGPAVVGQAECRQWRRRSLDSPYAAKFPILFGRRWPAGGLACAIKKVDIAALCAEYAALQIAAPRRSLAGKRYFVGHSGTTPATDKSNRLEEHYAIALANLDRRWPRPGGGWFRLLDYQVPLKARRTDTGVGKMDLLAVTDDEKLMIVELKVRNQSGGRSDSPPAALLEALRYSAMVEADFHAISDEVAKTFGVKLVREPPIVAILAPRNWWRAWFDLPAAGNWGPAFAALADAVTARTGVTITCMALEDVALTYGIGEHPPRLGNVPELYAVRPAEMPPIGDALPVPAPRGSESTEQGL